MAEMLSLLREMYPLRMGSVSAGLDQVTTIFFKKLASLSFRQGRLLDV